MCRTSSPTFANRPSPLAPKPTANASGPWSRNHPCHCARSQSEYASRSSRLNAKAIMRPRQPKGLVRYVTAYAVRSTLYPPMQSWRRRSVLTPGIRKGCTDPRGKPWDQSAYPVTAAGAGPAALEHRAVRLAKVPLIVAPDPQRLEHVGRDPAQLGARVDEYGPHRASLTGAGRVLELDVDAEASHIVRHSTSSRHAEEYHGVAGGVNAMREAS